MKPKLEVRTDYFRSNPKILDELLKTLESYIDIYDNGLPLHIDSELCAMRNTICFWLEKYGKHIKMRWV